MADNKLSALTELAATPAVDDEVYIRDVSEAAADESKRITIANLLPSAVAGATAGNLIVVSDDAEESTNSTTYTKIKEFGIARGGTLRIKFALQSADGGGGTTAYGRIYRSGVAVGTERTRTNTYGTFSQDIAGWSAGELVQLYAKTGDGGHNANVKEFRLYVSHIML